MREETRPEGRLAVLRVTVSGTVLWRAGLVYQVWNWVKGDGSRSWRWSVPIVNWAARVEVGWPESGGASPGATESVKLPVSLCSLRIVITS